MDRMFKLALMFLVSFAAFYHCTVPRHHVTRQWMFGIIALCALGPWHISLASGERIDYGYYPSVEAAHSACKSYWGVEYCSYWDDGYHYNGGGINLWFWGLVDGCGPGSTLSSSGQCIFLNQGQPQQCVGNPVDTATGIKYQREVDFEGGGLRPLVFARRYISSLSGNPWLYSFSHHIELLDWYGVIPAGSSNMVLVSRMVAIWQDDGRLTYFFVHYDPVDNAYETVPYHQDSTAKLTLGSPSLQPDGLIHFDSYTFTQDDGTEHQFDTQGRITRIVYPDGLATDIVHAETATERIVTVTHHNNQTLVIHTSLEGRLQSVDLPSQATIDYQYNDYVITQVTYPDDTPEDASDNPTKLYHYGIPSQPHLLTAITDESGVVYAHWTYDGNKRAVESKHVGDVDLVTLDYSQFEFATPAITATNALGKQTTYHYVDTPRGRRIQQVEGHPSDNCVAANQEYTYDALGKLASKTDWEGHITRYQYNASGQISRETRAEGTPQEQVKTTTWHPDFPVRTRVATAQQITDYVYNTQGLLTSMTVTDPLSQESRAITYTYTANGYLASIDGPLAGNGDSTQFSYSNGFLIKVTNALGHTTKYANHTANGYPQSIVDGNGIETVLAYDARDRLIASTLKAPTGDQTTLYTYNPLGAITDITLPDGTNTHYEYNDARQLTATSLSDGSRQEFTYDTAGNMIQTDYKNANDGVVFTQSRVYDELSRVMSITRGYGSTEHISYDKNGNVVQTTSALSVTTTHAFDALNQLIKTQFNDYYLPIEQTPRYSDYAEWSQTDKYPAFTLSNSGVSVEANINSWASGRATMGLSSGKWYWEIEHTGTGAWAIYGVATAQASLTAYLGSEMHSWGWIQSRDLRNNGVSLGAYIGWTQGDILMFALDMDAGHLWVGKNGVWAENGDPTTGANPIATNLGGLTVYPAYGQIYVNSFTANFGDRNISTAFAYSVPDGFQPGVHNGELLTPPPAEGGGENDPNPEILMSYDASRLQSVTDQRGLVTSYQYNGFNELTQRVNPDTGTTLFVYDAAGNMINSQDAEGHIIDYHYDLLNRMTMIDYASSSEDVHLIYDQVAPGNLGIGHLTQVNDASGEHHYQYNAQGLQTGYDYTVAGQAYVQGYTYNSVGQLTRLTYPSGRWVDYHYATDGHLMSITTQGSAQASEVDVVTDLDITAFGALASLTYGNGIHSQWTYYVDSQLTSLIHTGVAPLRQYLYASDANGNLLSIQETVTGAQQAFRYDASGRLVTATGTYGLMEYAYDVVGNRLTKAQTQGSSFTLKTYSYDANSQQLQQIVTDVDGNTSEQNIGYNGVGNMADDNLRAWSISYDAANRPVTLTTATGDVHSTYNWQGQRTAKASTAGTEHYHYNTEGQLLAVTHSNGQVIQEFIYLNQQVVAVATPNALYFAHNDHLSTPQLLTDQNQNVVWEVEEQTPFGLTLINEDPDGDGQSINFNLRFPGQYYDKETGYHYNYYRTYDPSTGRYLQSDPIGLEGGLNTYGYAGQNPVIYIDPLGLNFNLALQTAPPGSPARNLANKCLPAAGVGAVSGLLGGAVGGGVLGGPVGAGFGAVGGALAGALTANPNVTPAQSGYTNLMINAALNSKNASASAIGGAALQTGIHYALPNGNPKAQGIAASTLAGGLLAGPRGATAGLLGSTTSAAFSSIFPTSNGANCSCQPN